jgi:hypothetical protein
MKIYQIIYINADIDFFVSSVLNDHSLNCAYDSESSSFIRYKIAKLTM